MPIADQKNWKMRNDYRSARRSIDIINCRDRRFFALFTYKGLI